MTATEPVAPIVATAPPLHADSCRRDIPDCSAACALRETNQLEFIDWYDRRCAAVILGKNPDKVAGVAPDAACRSVPTPGEELAPNPYR